MEVLFLDIDGVLNKAGTPTVDGIYGIDESLLNLFHILTDECDDMKIVISSTWRKNNTLQGMAEHLGIATDYFHKEWLTTVNPNFTREGEILDWLSRHPEVTSVVILDDMTMPNIQNAIQRKYPYIELIEVITTDTYIGLTIYDIYFIVCRLSGIIPEKGHPWYHFYKTYLNRLD